MASIAPRYHAGFGPGRQSRVSAHAVRRCGDPLPHGMQVARFPLPFDNAPYSRALFDDEWVFVSGTLGMDYEKHALASGVEAQTRRMVANIAEYLEAGGASLDQIVNYTLIISAPEHLHPVIDTLAELLPGKPTGTAMIAGIVVPGAFVEMQVVARKSRTRRP